jgi:sugar phosphate isomerase/epimerase
MSKTIELLKELEELAAKLNIRIRYEKTNAKGGLCKKDDQLLIIIDRNADPHYKTSVIAEAIKKFDLSVRELIESSD